MHPLDTPRPQPYAKPLTKVSSPDSTAKRPENTSTIQSQPLWGVSLELVEGSAPPVLPACQTQVWMNMTHPQCLNQPKGNTWLDPPFSRWTNSRAITHSLLEDKNCQSHAMKHCYYSIISQGWVDGRALQPVPAVGQGLLLACGMGFESWMGIPFVLTMIP